MMRKNLFNLLLAVLFSVQIFAQEKTISGKVTSSDDGSALPGVSITIKGTTRGASTDENGVYKIATPANSVLVFSYVGFVIREIQINNRTIIDLQLAPDASVLNEVVVVGYGQQSKKLSTQSISTVGSKAIANRPVLSPQELLQGQAAGVQMVGSSGLLGANPVIRIRGAGSITGGGQPLFVVDGVPLNDGTLSGGQGAPTGLNPLLNINPQDIESMSVLKDAAAVSIYGSRGSNGVILINTKKGTSDRKTEINLDSYTGFSNPTSLIPMMNTEQFVGYVTEYRKARNLAPQTLSNDYFDWPTNVVQQGRTNNISLSARGGSQNTTFFIGGTYATESGFTIGNDLRRLAGRLNLEHKVNKFLTIGTNLSISNVNMDRIGAENSTFAPLTSAYLQLPNVLPRDASGNFRNTGFIQNVIGIEALNTNRFVSKRTTGNIYADFKIIKDLVFRTDFGMDYNSGDSKQRQVDLFTPTGSASRDFQYDSKWLSTNTLKYNKDFGKSTIGVLAGYSFETALFDRILVAGTGFASDGLPNVVSAATPTSTVEERSEWALESQFGRFNYGYDNRYVFEASLRRDGSSRFGADNRFALFYAVSGGWILSEEKFMKNQNFINFLKFTASYGTAGNDRIGNFSSLDLYGGGVLSDYAGSPGLRPTQVPNKSLTWEETAQLDIGFNTTFYKNRFNLSVNYFDKITSGILLDVPFPFTTGFPSASRNIGKMQNTGIEIDFNANIFDKGDFRWSVGFNSSFLKNKVLELPEASIDPDGNRFVAGSGSQRAVVGRTLNEFFMVKAIGVNPATGDLEWRGKDGTPTTTYSANNRVFVGSAIPKWTGGANTNMSYKGIDLSAQFSYSYGNKVLISGLGFTDNMSATAGFNKSIDVLDYWKKAGDVTFAPNLASSTAPLFNSTSTLQLQNGSFMRLRNLSLGYTFPSKLLEKQKVIRTFRIYGMGQNLWLLKDKNFRGPDPEVSANGPNNQILGESFFALPQAKTITFGLNLGF
ncbi:SusC/RagA family TonB-linked outer membrane protein [Emticicia sp.]|uniref:SusC/RagA family TonB-linked outer membrane protein n=1 Tax=Emticicia sp. TaxID=1930953 RepID=UPI003751854A